MVVATTLSGKTSSLPGKEETLLVPCPVPVFISQPLVMSQVTWMKMQLNTALINVMRYPQVLHVLK